jgi:flavin reductase (DIM6/NTAB) family NADH-FMN oxidoreductase RutF
MPDARVTATRPTPRGAIVAEKIDLGPQGFVYPMPMTLVGSDLAGGPTFMALAWMNRVQFTPPRVAVGANKNHSTNAGIREHGEFSVNFPDESMVAVTDWCGLSSARNVDKAAHFDVYRGTLEHAPLVAECPLSLECRVFDVLDLGSHELFVADIVGTWTEERFLTDGKPDIAKMRPFVLTMPDNRYWRVGEHLADAWSVGREFAPLK